MVKKLGLIVLVLALTSFIPVSAHEGIEHATRVEAAEHLRETAKELSSVKAQQSDSSIRKNAVCERAQNRLDKRIEISDKIKQRHLKRYQNLIDRLDSIVVRLEENKSEVSTTDISADITELNIYIADFETKFSSFVSSMRSAANIPCPTDGNTDSIKEAVATVRETNNDVRVAANTIRDYVRNEVVPHMQTIRDELDELSTDRNSTKSESAL